MKRFPLAVCGALLVLTAPGCDEPNPAYLGPAVGNGSDAAQGDSDAAFGEAGVDPTVDGGALFPDTLPGDGGLLCTPTICEANFGKAACGSWTCSGAACQVACANCQDKDHDGFGQGAGCGGADCDDNDPKVRGDAVVRACYEGPNGTNGKGSCRAGTSSCSSGVWTECQGQQLPSAEGCNNEDDDCNGKIDDLADVQCGLGACANTAKACSAQGVAICLPKTASSEIDDCGGGDGDCDGLVDEDCAKCVHVTGSGVDSTADGTDKRPFKTIQAAVDWAAGDATRPQQVCVAATAACNEVPSPALKFLESDNRTLLMKNGVSVTGGYESTTWNLCPPVVGGVVPRNAPVLVVRSAEGIAFLETITKPTALSGFVLERQLGVKVSAAITIRGAKGATVTNVVVLPIKAIDVNIGINISANAEALVARSDINVGEGSLAAVGVRVKDASASILDNCGSFDDKGRCKAACVSEGPAISAGSSENKGGETVAVLLEGATSASVQNNGLCAGPGRDSAGLKVLGNSPSTVVSGNVLRATGGTAVCAGAWFASCGGGQPWLVGNQSVTAFSANPDTRLAGVLSEGNCHPRIEGNALVGATGTVSKNVAGIHCDADGAATSGCQILRNAQIKSAASVLADVSVGIRCEAGACARIAGNALVDAGRSKRTIGLWLDGGTARVDANVIQGGCGSVTSTGIVAVDSGSRVQNNVVFGATCESNTQVVAPTGVSIVIGHTRRSIDLHSNTLDTARGSGDCTGTTLSVSTRMDTLGGTIGFARNNILSHHVCRGGLMEERDTKAHLAAIEANLFDKDDDDDHPVFLSNGKDVLSVSDLNKNSGGSVRRGNILGDPKFINWPGDLRLQDGSSAIDKGTTAAAPAIDFSARVRDDKPDIGAFEHQ